MITTKTVGKKQKKEIKFPVLVRLIKNYSSTPKGTVVLFTDNFSGTIVFSNDSTKWVSIL